MIWLNLQKIDDLVYEKSSIDLFIHNAIGFHKTEVSSFVNDNTDKYHIIEVIGHEDKAKEWHVRNQAVQKCADLKSDFLFVSEQLPGLPFFRWVLRPLI